MVETVKKFFNFKALFAFGSAFALTAIAMSLDSQALAQVASPLSVNEINENVESSVSELPALLAGLSYLFGILFGVTGVLKIKEHVENPTQNPARNAYIRLVIGGALFALPIIFEAVYLTINGPGGAFGTGLLYPLLDKAGEGSIFGSLGGGTTEVNDIAENIVSSSDTIPGVIAGVSYLVGILLAVLGLLKIKDHVENPQQTPIRTGVIRLLAAGALMALPAIYGAVFTTISGGASDLQIDNGGIIDTVSGFFGGVSSIIPTLNINNILTNILDATNEVPALIAAICYVMGLLFGALGVIKLKDHVESPEQVPLKEGVIRLLVAGALFAAPSIFNAMFTAIGGSGLGFSGAISGLATVFSWAVPGYGGQDCFTGSLGNTMGSAICNTLFSSMLFPAFLTAIAYTMGLVLGVWGIMKVKAHVQNPQQVSLWEPISRFIAGGAFFALPIMIEVAKSSLTPGALDPFAMAPISGYNNSAAAGGGCSSAGGLDTLLTCFMSDMVGPLHLILNFFTFVAGVILVMVGISRLLKSAQDGARGPGGLGTIMTFAAGGALLSYNQLVRAFSGSFFTDTTTATFATLEYTNGMTTAEQNAAHATISAVLQFVIIVGLISFIRGIFIIRSAAEGNQQASIMSGLTHIAAGALAVNLGPLINAVEASLGLTGFGIAFS